MPDTRIPRCRGDRMSVQQRSQPPRSAGRAILAACIALVLAACEPQTPAPVFDGASGRVISPETGAIQGDLVRGTAETIEDAAPAVSPRDRAAEERIVASSEPFGRTEPEPAPAPAPGTDPEPALEPEQPTQTADGAVGGTEEAAPSNEAAELPVLLEIDPVADDGRRVVAILLPLSDSNSRRRALALAMENAARLAIEDIGPGAPRLVAYDTAGGRGSAAEAAKQAVDDGAELILGPLLGSKAVEIQPVALERGVNAIAFSTDESAAGNGVYLIGSLPSAEFRRILRFAAVERGYRTLAGILPGSPYGAQAKSALERVAVETGSELAATVTYGSNFDSAQEAALSFADIHTSSSGSGGGRVAVLVPQSGSLLATLAAFLSQRGLLDGEVQLLGTGVWDAEATIREDALRGGWFAAPDPRRRAGFSGRYLERYGSRPPLLASLAYDAAVVAGTPAVRRGEDPFSRRAITDPGGFLGVAGAFRFTRAGLNERALAVLRVDEGGFRIIDPAPEGFPAF